MMKKSVSICYAEPISRPAITKITKLHVNNLEYLISRLDILKEMTERLCKEKIAEYNAMAENG